MEQERVGKTCYKNNVSALSQLVHKTGGAYPRLSNINQLHVRVFQSTMYCTLNRMPAIAGLPLFCKHIRQLTHWILELLAKNLFFGQFGNFQPGYEPHELQSTYSKCIFSNSFHYYHVLQHFCLGIHRNQNFDRKWPTSLHIGFFLFLICLLPWLTFYWARFQLKKVLRKHHQDR